MDPHASWLRLVEAYLLIYTLSDSQLLDFNFLDPTSDRSRTIHPSSSIPWMN